MESLQKGKEGGSSNATHPGKKAAIIEKLSHSPRTWEILESKGAVMSKDAKKKLKLADAVLESLQTSLSQTKAHGGSNLHQKVAHENLAQGAIGRIARKYRVTSKLHSLLHVRRRHIRKGWYLPKKRKQRKDLLPSITINLIQEWFVSSAIAREVPCKRSVMQSKNEAGDVQVLPTFLMTMTLKEAFQLFKEEHSEVKIGFTSFRKLKPKEVRRISETNRRTCLCQICSTIALHLETLKKFADTDIMKPIVSKKILADLTLCGYDTLPASKCLNRECASCSHTNLAQHFADDVKRLEGTTIQWPRWEYVTLSSPSDEPGAKKRVLSCVVKETSFDNFLEQCQKDIATYPKHYTEAAWQTQQLSHCIEKCATASDIVLVMDYSENYRVSYQNEVQSAFFDPVQVTIHPMMFYYKKDDLVVKHAIIGISNDPKHDAIGVKHFLEAALTHLANEGMTISSMHEWTDGCAGQYKGKHAFLDISEKLIPTTRNYFVTSHGKNVCDGLGAVVKNMALRHVIGCNIIANAKGMMEFCESKVAHGPRDITRNGEKYISRREFVYIEASEVNHQRPDVQTLVGTRKLHAIQCTGKRAQLKSRNLSCYCQSCVEGTAPGACKNRDYVDKWKPEELKLTNPPVDVQKNIAAPVLASRKKKAADPKPSKRLTRKSTLLSANSTMHGGGSSTQHEVAKVAIDDLTPGTFVAVHLTCATARKNKTQNSVNIYMAEVLETDEEMGEVLLAFMERTDSVYKHKENDQAYQPIDDIVSRMTSPTMMNARAQFRFTASEIEDIKHLFAKQNVQFK